MRLLLPPAVYDELHEASCDVDAKGATERVLRTLFHGEAYDAFVSMLRSGVRLPVVVVPELDAAYLEDGLVGR